MHKTLINNRIIFTIIYSTFLVLVLSDWLEESVGLFLPAGFEHATLLFGFIILYLATKNKNYRIDRARLISLGIIISLCFVMLMFLPVRKLNFFLGAFFTTFGFAFQGFFSRHFKGGARVEFFENVKTIQHDPMF